MKEIINSRIIKITIAALLGSLLISIGSISPSSATVSTTVASVYVDAPFVQGSYASSYGGVTENFNGISIPNNNSVSISSNSYSIVGGTKTSGQFTVFTNNSTYGASTTSETATVNGSGTQFANTDSTGFEITFSTPVKYIGFFWAAGNAGNSVTLYSGSTEIATYSTTDLNNLLGSFPANYASATDSLTATNGDHYLKKYYFGPPNGYASQTPTSQSTIPYANEPYAYVHAFAQNDESFDRIKFFGSGFEFDNITVSTQEVPIRNSLVLVNDVTTTLTLGQSNWNFKGVTSADSTTVSTGWLSDSSTVVSSKRISVEQQLSISSGTITMGRTALFQTPITNTTTNTCGSSFSLIDSYTATNSGYRDILLSDNGTPTRDLLIRGYCYKWTMDPSSSLGSGAIRPTSSAANTRFNSNLESPMIIIPIIPNDNCQGIGRLVNGDFESLPSGITEASVSNNNNNNGTWHGYNGNNYTNPRQILFLTDQTDTSTNSFKIDGWNIKNGASTFLKQHRVEIQRFVPGSGQESVTGTATFDNSGVQSASGSYLAEINAEDLGTLYQDVRVSPGTKLRWRMYHRGRAMSGTDEMKVRIGPASAPLSDFTNTAVTTYDNTPTRRPSSSGSGASMQDARGSVSLKGGPNSVSDSQTVGGSTGGWGYYEGTYTVGANETSTRFAFVSISVSSGNSTVGNLIDAINFSPLVACPATFNVVAGRTTLINPFDLNLNGNPNGVDITDSLGWDNAYVTETITATGGTFSRTSYGGVTNRAINYTAPNTTGTYLMDFTIGNSYGDASTSRLTINVIPDTGARAPGGLPVDPRVTTYKLSLPQVTSATGQVLACLQQLNSNGDTITGTIKFDVGRYGSAQDTITALGDTVTLTIAGISTDYSNYLRISGPIASVNNVLLGLRLTLSNNAKFKGIYYLRFSSVVTGLSTAPDPTNCDNAISSAKKDITLRPMTLYEIRRKVVPLINGKT